jgi:hypothetical protein
VVLAAFCLVPGCIAAWVAVGQPMPPLPSLFQPIVEETATTGPALPKFDYSHGLPVFTGMQVQLVGAALIRDGYRVVVHIEPRIMEKSVNPIRLRAGGIFVGGMNMPSKTVAFGRRGGWDHPVDSQSPIGGTMLAKGGLVTLTVGRHNGGGSLAKPWAIAHGTVVKKKGAVPCLVCHYMKECQTCHKSKSGWVPPTRK